VTFDSAAGFLAGLQKMVDPITVPELDDLAPEAHLEPDSLVVSVPRDSVQNIQTAAAPTRVAVTAEAAAQLPQALAQLRISRTGDGDVTIEAPPAAAKALASLLQGIASQLLAG
jgi:hypothetical protein